MNITTHAILINSCSRNEASSIRKVYPRCLTYVEKICNVSRYEFTSIAVYKLVGLYSLSVIYPEGFLLVSKEGFCRNPVETAETLLDPPLFVEDKQVIPHLLVWYSCY